MSKAITIRINKKLRHLMTSIKRFLVVWGGRGSGKSYGISDILLTKTLSERNIIILCTKQTQVSIKDSVYSLLRQRIIDLSLQEYFELTDVEIRCVLTGSKFIFKGLNDPENSIKSIAGIKYAWVEEAQTLKRSSWEVLTPSIREENSQIFITFNPRFDDDCVYEEFISRNNPLAEVIELQYTDNPDFPEVLRLEMEEMKARNLFEYEHIWLGKIKKIDPKALWKRESITYFTELDKAKYKDSDLERIVVAVDPSVTSKESSDACGIVVAGKYKNEQRYVILGDYTLVGSPLTWANKAAEVYFSFKADRLIAEQNNGGDLVKQIIKNVNPTIAYKGVWASRGKIVRAEPIAALYEEGKVVHYSNFPELEKELLTYIGATGQKSPNRLDALVWALTELSGTGTRVLKGAVRAPITTRQVW